MNNKREDRPLSILKDLETDTLRKYSNSTEVVGLLVEYNSRDEALKINNIPDTSVVILDNVFAVVFVPFNRILELEPYVKDIVSLQIPVIYTLEQYSPVEASGAPLFHRNPLLQLDGERVIVGIVDTGIDYLNKEFMREDGTTRILRIWDQTLDLEDPNGVYSVKMGVEYNSTQINEAIKSQDNNQDPYSIVKTRDTIGHGTMVASLIGARGFNPDLTGVAPDCNFVIVKLKQAPIPILDYAGISNIPGTGRYKTIEIILALRYLAIVLSEIGGPMVICTALGSNIGSHDGTNLVERSFNTLSSQSGVVCVTGVGNEGDTDTHTEGKFNISGEQQIIEVRVGKTQKNLSFQIYIAYPDKVSIGISSPSGEFIEKITVRLNRVEDISFVYEGTRMRVSYIYPEQYTGDQVINIEARDITEGIWQFRLYGDYIVDGRYWSWMPQRSLLDPDTKFLSPNQYTTLTIPGTGKGSITAAYYNQNNNATIGQSGRGFTRDGRVKPDITAGGINALVTSTGRDAKAAGEQENLW